jgi:F-type H+-transporting ATPase subunit a
VIRRLSLLAGAFALALAGPAQALAADEPKTDPTKEFLLDPWIKIPKIGPIDLSITKGVFFLLLSTAVLLIGALAVAHNLKMHPKRLQAFVEIIYDFSETQIGRASLPAKTYTTWFPYLATLFLFIWINNMISYLPLPVDTEHKIGGWLPTPSFYATTSNISVTLALTLVTFFASHYVGIKYQGFVPYFKHWVPPAPKAVRPIIAVLEVLSQFLRLISLSVRLFANMLAGHLILVTFGALCAALFAAKVTFVIMPFSFLLLVAMTGFEILVSFLQAFIFTILTAVYIGGARQPEH